MVRRTDFLRFVLLWILCSVPVLGLLPLAHRITFWAVILLVPLLGCVVGIVQQQLLRHQLHWMPLYWVRVTALALIGAVLGGALVMALIVPLHLDLTRFVDRLIFYLLPVLTFRLLLSTPQAFLMSLDIQHAQYWVVSNAAGALFVGLLLASTLADPDAIFVMFRPDVALAVVVPAAFNSYALVWLRQHELIPDSEAEPVRVAMREG